MREPSVFTKIEYSSFKITISSFTKLQMIISIHLYYLCNGNIYNGV